METGTESKQLKVKNISTKNGKKKCSNNITKPNLSDNDKLSDSSNAQFDNKSTLNINKNSSQKSSKADNPTEHKMDDNQQVNIEFMKKPQEQKRFQINVEVDAVAAVLFAIAVATRFYKLDNPRNIVFDELHYGRYISLYMKRTFYFDSNPPFGKQLIAAVAYLAGFNGTCKFERIGSDYGANVPLFALRSIPALCGSLLVLAAYCLVIELGCSQWSATLAACLLLADNALLTQSRFMLMESSLLLFSVFGLLGVLRFRRLRGQSRWAWFTLAFISLTLSLW